MKKLFVLVSLALALWAPEAVAQARTVTGRVTATETGQPISGVAVSVPGTQIGTVTDPSGRYSLDVPANATMLAFRSLAYGAREVAITGTELNVTLESQVVALEGVVVTALGMERQTRTLGVASEQVNSEDIPQGRVVSQEPPAGDQIDEGSEVDFAVSSGPAARTLQPAPSLIWRGCR